MQSALRIVDQTPGGKILRESTLQLVSEKITVRDLIKRRVCDEVDRFNAQQNQAVFQGLVQPTDTEVELNGYRMRSPRLLDADTQCAAALEAFTTNGFFMLVDDHQVEALDEEIAIGPATRVSFVKLVPMVGG